MKTLPVDFLSSFQASLPSQGLRKSGVWPPSRQHVENNHYAYFCDLRDLNGQSLGGISDGGSAGPTPVHPGNWAELLSSHPDQEFALYIQAGLSSGFHIGYNRLNIKLISASRNHPSAAANPSVVADYIWSECEAGWMAGPITDALCPRGPGEPNRPGAKITSSPQVVHDCRPFPPTKP